MFTDRLMDIIQSDKTYPIFSVATLLQGLSHLYGGAIRQRLKLYEQGVLRAYRLPCPVVSVGNLMVGGMGKTPMVMHLAKFIQGRGYRVAVISRGYKGAGQKRGVVVSDGRSLLCDMRMAGDEPYLMATLLDGVPVVVGKDRYDAGRKAVSLFNPDVIVLDDAFQHLRIKRDLDLVLLDAQSPFGNSFLLPRGRLREPVAALYRANAVVMTRADPRNMGRPPELAGIEKQLPVFRSVHRGVIRGVAGARSPLPPMDALGADVSQLKGLKLFAFSGLGNNSSFFNSLKSQFGGILQGTLAYEDHYAYGEKEVAHIGRSAVDAGAELLVTTDKDYVRLLGMAQFPMKLVVVGVDIEFTDDSGPWRQFLVRQIDHLIRQREAG